MFDSRKRQHHFNKSPAAYVDRSKTGEQVFDRRGTLPAYRIGKHSEQKQPPYDFNKIATAYCYRFKKGEQVFDSREMLPASPIGKHSELDQQQQLLKQQAINTIISDIQTDGSWNNIAGEIAVKAVTGIPTWPCDNHVEVRLTGGHYIEYGRQVTTRPLVLQLAQGHYEAVIAGKVTAVASDGNCFYHALLLTLNDTEQQQLLGTAFIPYGRKSVADDSGNPNVMALRRLLASHLQDNTPVISDYLTANGVSDEQVLLENEAGMARSRKLQIEQDAVLARKLQIDQDATLAQKLQQQEVR